MNKNITFSADEEDIRAAREKALRERLTLNDAFRRWLRSYAREIEPAAAYKDLMKCLKHVNAGRSFSRDELNER